jgi:transcriptional regulator with XRE-family HTH domain
MPTGYLLEIKMSFGENLKRLRRDKGWTQLQLAKAADLKLTHIPKLENDGADPKLSSIYKLLGALGCSADTLIMDSEKVGTDAILKATIERAANLPEGNKRVLIDVIDKYCIAVGLEQSFSKENSTGFRILTESYKSPLTTEK